MIRNFFSKIKNVFKKRKSGAIPFAERSREAVKDVPFSIRDVKERKSKFEIRKPGPKPSRPDRPQGGKPSRPDRPQGDKSSRPATNRAPRPIKEKLPPVPNWNMSDFPVPEVDGKLRFQDLNLADPILHAIADLNFQYCTPVQAGILPDALNGKDAIGKAQTGTGKSAAFLVTIFTHILRNPITGGPPKGQPRALILAPTRELVLQIEKDALGLCKYTPIKILSVFGGIGYDKQMRFLKERSFDVIVATPGRLIDFKNKNLIKLDKIEILVLDEADRMLDMGFMPDVRNIVYSTPHKNKRQTFFYSATVSPEVTRMAEQWTTDPVKIEIEPEQVASDSVKQVIYITTSKEKFPLLYNLITKENLERVLVFTNRRDQARDLALKLSRYAITTSLISGEIHQNKRIKALEDFREGKCRVLVATDVAARGLHVDDISHVINFNLPQDAENYVHRIGRTGRAGTKGISVSFACEDDSFHIPDIEAFLGNDLICEHPDDELLKTLPPPSRSVAEVVSDDKPQQRKSQSRNRTGSRPNERPPGSRTGRPRRPRTAGKPRNPAKPGNNAPTSGD